MLRLLPTAAIALVGLLMFGCKSGRSVLRISELPTYDERSPNHILFLNFRITGKLGKKEKVELVSAQVANGKMKNPYHPINYPAVRIKAVLRYTNGVLEHEMAFLHPLYQLVEVGDPSGHIRREEVRAKEGRLLIRMPVHSDLNSLELFSVMPERGSVKIYTLSFN